MCALITLKLTLGVAVPLSVSDAEAFIPAPSTVLTLFQIFSYSKRRTVLSYFVFSLQFTNGCTSLVSECSLFCNALHTLPIF